MADGNQYPTEVTRLRRMAAESRLRAVETQIALAFTLCKIAETAIRYGRIDEARMLLNRLRLHAETIRAHIDEPNHLPSAAILNLRKQMAELLNCAEAVESRLRQR